MNQDYIDALNYEVVRISPKYDRVSEELIIFVDCRTRGSQRVSLQFFQGRTLTELWVLKPKVSTSSELGILLAEKLLEYAEGIGPEVIPKPSQVKFLKGKYSSNMPAGFKITEDLFS